MNKSQSPSVASTLENLTNLFYLMVGVPLLAFVWVYLNLKTIYPNTIFSVPAFRPLLHGGILLAALLIAIWAFVQYRRSLLHLKPYAGPSEHLDNTVEKKVDLFRKASLKKYAMLTLSTLLVILGFYLSAEENYAAAYSILLIVFSVNRPTLDRLLRDTRMKKEERDALFEAYKKERQGQK